MSKVKVSVVMPVYNAEEYLNETLECLTHQTMKEIEIICVDDGSKDSSLEILKKYSEKDDRIKILHQKNLYAGVARNNGLKEAKGEYIIFLDSDDLFELDLLEKTYKKGKEINADIVLFNADHYNTRTKEYMMVKHLLRTDLIGDNEVFSRQTIPDFLFQVTTPCPWTKLYRKEFVIKKNLHYQNLKYSNDVFFVLASLAVAEKITYVDDILVHYRVNQTKNLQSLKKDDPTLFFKAYEEIYDLLNKENIYSDLEKSFITTVLSGCVYNIDTVNTQEAKTKIYKKIQSVEFQKMNIMGYPREYYWMPWYYDRLKSIPNILKCYEKRNRNYSENGFQLLKEYKNLSTPKISVIIPIYNTEKYVEECIRSIQRQTLQEIEIICVDDGSTDKSLEVVRSINDNRISVYKEKNSGQSVARNRGIDNAKGKYLYFMDSDDVLTSDALEKLYIYAETNALDIVYFDGMSFWDDNLCKEIANQDLHYYERKYEYPDIYTGKQMLKEMHANEEYRVSPCLQMINKGFIENYNLKFEEGIIHEDNLFTYKCILNAGRVGYIHECFFKRRYRNDSVMTKKTTFEHVYGYFKCFVKMQDFLMRQNIDEDTLDTALSIERSMLRSARNKYLELDTEEKEAIRGLEVKEKLQFESYICDWFTEKRKVWMANNRTEKQIQEVKNTETFKIGAAIVWLPRKIKNIFQKSI